MLPLFPVINLVLLLAVLAVLLLRRPGAAAAADPKLEQLLAADLPGQLARAEARAETAERHLRDELSAIRRENAAAAADLRTEVVQNLATLGENIRNGLGEFRGDNSAAAERLRLAVDAQLRTIGDRMSNLSADSARHLADNRSALDTRLGALGEQQAAQQDRLRTSVEQRLDKLNEVNAAKLEEMRQTVDEKLHTTLQTRLTESFGQVTDQLTRVHAGLGEMTKLSAGVDDLSRIFTNVKSRGTIGEVMLETLLKQMLAPAQYMKNVKTKPGSNDMVEFAVKFPTPQGETLLPIDSKFPREVGDRLETAYATGSAAEIVSAGKAFESAIRNEAKKICDKYLSPPQTTSFAVMFLPTEGLYAEVMRRDGLQSDIQQNCRVTITGPSTLSAILTSFQMGFHMLELQEKGDDVWKVLAKARKEFGTFETLMDKMTEDVGRVQGTIDKLGVRTRAINRSLRDVNMEGDQMELPAIASGFDGLAPMIAAESEDA